MGCSESFLHALNYSQVAGLCAGMIALGLIVDRIGRKWGSVSTALIMFVGGASSQHVTQQAKVMRSYYLCGAFCQKHMITIEIL